jgi:hypothetical protein
MLEGRGCVRFYGVSLFSKLLTLLPSHWCPHTILGKESLHLPQCFPPEPSKNTFHRAGDICGRGGVWDEDAISCFHFQFFRKKGLPLVFDKCFHSNNQLWSRRGISHIFNEPRLIRCHPKWWCWLLKTFQWSFSCLIAFHLEDPHEHWWLQVSDTQKWLDHNQWPRAKLLLSAAMP